MSEDTHAETYKGHELEATVHGLTGEIYLVRDGNESTKVFPTITHALDYGRHKIDLQLRREDPDRVELALPYLPESWDKKFYAGIGWDDEKKEFTS